MRQKYQEKIVDSHAAHEPRKIFDIVNSIDDNCVNSVVRTAISALSDTSDSSSSQDEEDLINELIHLRAVADEVAPIGPNGPLPVIRVIGPTPSGSTLSLARPTSGNSDNQAISSDERSKPKTNEVLENKKVTETKIEKEPEPRRDNDKMKSWRKQVSFENEVVDLTKNDNKVAKVKRPKTRKVLNRGRSLDQYDRSSDSDSDSVENTPNKGQAPTKPPRRHHRRSKQTSSGSDLDSHAPKLKGILKKQGSQERPSADEAKSKRLLMRRGSSVDSALPPPAHMTGKVSNGLRLRHGQDIEDISHSRSGPLVMSKELERPGAPYPLREQDGRIWLTWQECSPGSFYKLQVRSNDQQQWADVSDNIDQNVHIVTGLVPGVSYRFRVAMRNRNGESIPSKASQRIGVNI